MFEKIEKLNVSGKTSRMMIPELGHDAYVELRIADESNARYYNAILKLGAERAEKRMKRGNKVDPAMLVENRKIDSELFPKYVIVGWGGEYFDNVCPEGWSVEAAQEFVEQLCQHAPRIFDEIRAHAGSPDKYLDWDELEPATDNLSGN